MSAPLTLDPSALGLAELARRPSIHDASAVEQFFRERRWDPYWLKRLRYLMYAEAREPRRLLESLPVECRDEVSRAFTFHASEIVERVESERDGATKLLFRTADQRLFEAVLMRNAAGRVSLCVSSQVGCAAACRFCATGSMGLTRNLREGEILDQVYQANRLLRATAERVRNVVFMGMGEPFHNEAPVCEAVEKLQHPAWFGLSPRRIVVSTVGIPDAMLRFATRFPITGLALSLHTTDPSLRERLIPLARRYPLEHLRGTLGEVQRLQRCPLMIEYLMLDEINDSDQDADGLADYLQGLHVHVNLIPYNMISAGTMSAVVSSEVAREVPLPHFPHADLAAMGNSFRPTPRIRRDAFANRLRQRGLLVTIRYSRGSDIAAACGQLVRDARPRRPMGRPDPRPT